MALSMDGAARLVLAVLRVACHRLILNRVDLHHRCLNDKLPGMMMQHRRRYLDQYTTLPKMIGIISSDTMMPRERRM